MKAADAFSKALVSGAVGALTCTAGLMLAGKRLKGAPFAPLNAVSHWLWGDAALRRRRLTLRDTVLGYGIHHAASVFWAVPFEWWCARRPPGGTSDVLRRATTIAALAFIVDFTVTPRRLSPGFEHHLPLAPRVLVYAMFAGGLAAGALARRNAP